MRLVILSRMCIDFKIFNWMEAVFARHNILSGQKIYNVNKISTTLRAFLRRRVLRLAYGLSVSMIYCLRACAKVNLRKIELKGVTTMLALSPTVTNNASIYKRYVCEIT